MTGNKMIGLLAAAALALGTLTAGCVDDGTEDGSPIELALALENPYPFEVEDLLHDPADGAVIGYVSKKTMDYVFDNGRVIPADAITDAEIEVAIPDKCENECTEGGGELQPAGPSTPIYEAIGAAQLYAADDETPDQADPWDLVALYVDDDDGMAVCWLVCEEKPHPECWEVCEAVE